MKRVIITLLAVLTALGGLNAQMKWKRSDDFRKHNFGFGAATDIFSTCNLVNSFGGDLTFDHRVFDVGSNSFKKFRSAANVTAMSRFSLHFAYEYRFNKNFSLSAGLKYAYMNMEVKLVVADDTRFLSDYPDFFAEDRYNAVFHSVEVPIMVNYSTRMCDKTFWNISLGGGLREMITADLSSFRGTKGEMVYGVESMDDFQPFLSFGTGLEFSMCGHRLKTFVNYSIYDVDYVISSRVDNVLSTSSKKKKFGRNHLEVGCTLFF